MFPTKKLSEICKIKTGKKDVNEGNSDGEFPFFTCAREHTFSDSFSFDMEALLIAGNGDVGHVQYYKGKFEAYQRTYILYDFSSEISVSFLFQYLGGFLKETVSKQKLGNTMPYIKLGMLTDFEIPLPPLSIQLDIVARLDSAMTEIDLLRTETESALASTRELWESILESVFASGESDLEEKRLGDVYDVRDGTHDSPKYQSTGYPLITSKNLRPEGLSFDNIKLISERDYQKINERSKVHKGDILFAMIGTIGSPTIVEIEPEFAIKNVALFKVPETQSNRFLKYFLSSRFVVQKMMSESKGSTQKFVGLGYLRDFKIKLPPLSEQSRIVAHLDAVRAETERLEKIYTEKLESLDELKQSVLQEVFA